MHAAHSELCAPHLVLALMVLPLVQGSLPLLMVLPLLQGSLSLLVVLPLVQGSLPLLMVLPLVPLLPLVPPSVMP